MPTETIIVPTLRAPSDLDLHEYARLVPAAQSGVGFMPPALVAVNDTFSVTTLTRFGQFSEGTPVTPTIASNQITFANTSGQNTILNEGADMDMCQFAVSLRVVSLNLVAGNAYENVGVGFVKDSNNFIFAAWIPMDSPSHASIQVKIGGSNSFNAQVTVSWTPPFDIGLSLVANSLVFWQRPNGGSWAVVTTFDVTSLFNFKTSSLTGWKGGFSFASAATHPCTLVATNFQTGRFGAVGLRDPNPVVALDGTPQISGNVLTFTATATDPSSAAYTGVYTVDLLAGTLAQTGVITVAMGTSLPGAGGTTSGTGSQNHNAAQIVLDGSGGAYLWMTSWGFTGAANIQVLMKHVTGNTLISGANAVSGMTQLALAGIPSGGGMYDPCAVFTGGLWYLATTVGPTLANAFYPALQSSPDLVTWTLIGSDSVLAPFEGSRICKVAGSYWVTWASMNYGLVYDLTFKNFGGIRLPYTISSGHPPHVSLVQIPNDAWVRQVTFSSDLAGGVSNTDGRLSLCRALAAWR